MHKNYIISNNISGEIMEINIRSSIKNNFKDCSIDDLEASINESINDEEVVLPGLGVLFEILWKNTSNKKEILETIYNNIKG